MAINIEKADGLAGLMEERGIRDEDVQKVIEEAESSGDKMYKPDAPDCLAKAKCGESWVFVEYTVLGDDNYRANKTYTMKTEFAEDI
ncbi:MAG: hypothetical protein R6U37_03065 [Dehalococcoidia bacterium]